jgi:hypothetical protein
MILPLKIPPQDLRNLKNLRKRRKLQLRPKKLKKTTKAAVKRIAAAPLPRVLEALVNLTQMKFRKTLIAAILSRKKW